METKKRTQATDIAEIATKLDGKVKFSSIIYSQQMLSEKYRETVPIDYTAGISDSARRTMLGEGWTVDIIAHIFRYIKNTPGNP